MRLIYGCGLYTGKYGTLLFLFTGRVFNGSGKAIDKGPAVMAEDFLDIQGKAEMYQAVRPIYEL